MVIYKNKSQNQLLSKSGELEIKKIVKEDTRRKRSEDIE